LAKDLRCQLLFHDVIYWEYLQNRKSSDIIIWYHKTKNPPLNLRNRVQEFCPL